MADPREVEGSAQRAADRGRSLGFDAIPISTEATPYLGDRDAVDGIVRTMLSKIIDARGKFHRQQLSGDAATKQETDAINAAAAIFNGQTPGYQLMPAWNKPEGVGNYVKQRRGWDIPAADAVRSYLAVMANLTTEVFDSYCIGHMDDEDARWRLDVNVEDITNMMLGLNPSMDD